MNASIHLVVHPAVHPFARYLILNYWVEFYQTCYITSPHGKGVQEQHYFCMCPLSVHLLVTRFPPKPLDGIQPNLLHHMLLHPFSIHLSVTLSPKPPVGTKLATSLSRTFPHGKDVWEQHYFLCVWRLSICPSCYLLLNLWAEFSQTCYMTFPHGKGVGEQVRLVVYPFSHAISNKCGVLRWHAISCAV